MQGRPTLIPSLADRHSKMIGGDVQLATGAGGMIKAPVIPRPGLSGLDSQQVAGLGKQSANCQSVFKAQNHAVLRGWKLLGVSTWVTALTLWIAACSPQPIVPQGHPQQEFRMSLQPKKGEVPCGVWRVQGKRNVLYLAATMHDLSKDQIPFPSPFYAAYQDSKEITMEVNLSSPWTKGLISLAARQWLKSHQADFVCPSNRKLQDYLAKKTVQRLKERFGEKYPNVERFTPLGIICTIDLLIDEAIHESLLDAHGGVEDYFRPRAQMDHKPIRELDDVPNVTHSVFLEMDYNVELAKAEIKATGADAVLNATILADQKDIIRARVSESQRMLAKFNLMWRRGDSKMLDQYSEMYQRENPEEYDASLVRRNHRWLLKIKEGLSSSRNQMVLAGAAHMGGDDGLIKLLQQEGYRVDQLYGIDRPTVDPAAKPVPILKTSEITKFAF